MKPLLTSLRMLFLLTIITGIGYPLLITGTAQLFFNEMANGSLIMKDGKVMGSKLLGQQMDSATFFSSRPSATDYGSMPSGGSNLSLSSRKLKDQFEERKSFFILKNNIKGPAIIPAEMLFASASGLDPHISPYAAVLQIDRIAGKRGFNTHQRLELHEIVKKMTEPPQLFFLGEPRVNVLLLNLAIEQMR